MDTMAEQRLLRLSIVFIALISAAGLVVGIAGDSRAILFDGVYSIIDGAMTVVSLGVSRLIGTEWSPRFQFGYWHLEPMIAALNGGFVVLACVYAFTDALSGILHGGHSIDFGIGTVYAGANAIICVGLWLRIARGARQLDSELLRVDARGWLIGFVLNLALFASFGASLLVVGTSAGNLARYADPVILLVLSASLAPLPLGGIVRALRDVFQIAPRDLDVNVRRVMDALVAEHGFTTYASYVTCAGRGRFVELHVVLPAEMKLENAAQLDRYRDEILVGLGGSSPLLWLTVAFTADTRWI